MLLSLCPSDAQTEQRKEPNEGKAKQREGKVGKQERKQKKDILQRLDTSDWMPSCKKGMRGSVKWMFAGPVETAAEV